MTSNNQVNWEEIPEDVEAVITYKSDVHTYCKMIGGVLYVQCWRDSMYEDSCISLNYAKDRYGDRFHLRPTPTTKPTPEPPESTQVETSEVEATTTPDFDWSGVDDDDVEAVFLHGEGRGQWQQWYKTVDGHVMVRYPPEVIYKESFYTTLLERINDADGVSKYYIRPSPTTTPEDIGLNAAYDIYKKVAAEVDKVGVDSKPSILTILQEAQQSILKHHGVTGKVKFTVTCSE